MAEKLFFSMYTPSPVDSHMARLLRERFGPERPKGHRPHEYLDNGGMCYHCTLDQQGHDLMQAKVKEMLA